MSRNIQRFYKETAVQKNANGHYEILLDGRPVKTPARHVLSCANAEIAQALAEEWDAQEKVINPDIMPLTRIHTIAQDRAAQDKPLILEDMLRYLETDMLCYRAARNYALHDVQAAMFDPMVAAFNARYDVALAITDGLMPISQPEIIFSKVREALAALPLTHFAALALATPLLGSLVLALLMLHGDITAEQAWQAARLDETYAAEHYGKDPTLEASLAAKQRDILAVGLIFTAK